jgi:ElaB/YqjD/DUF883 family membrane-anchored ribosome-binding protein
MATYSSRVREASSDASEQIRELRSQVDQLMRDRIAPTVSEAAGRAQDYARQAQDVARDQAEALSSQVREMPLVSVLVAAVAGYLLGRLAR